MIDRDTPEGYNTRPINADEMRERFPYQHRFRYLNGINPSQFHWLLDRLYLNTPDYQLLMRTIEKVSPSWVVRLKSQLINDVVKKYIIFLRSPQQFDGKADNIFGSNYYRMKYKLDRTSKALHMNYGEMKYMRFKVDREHLGYMSKVFATHLLPVAMNGMKHYRKYCEMCVRDGVMEKV